MMKLLAKNARIKGVLKIFSKAWHANWLISIAGIAIKKTTSVPDNGTQTTSEAGPGPGGARADNVKQDDVRGDKA